MRWVLGVLAAVLISTTPACHVFQNCPSGTHVEGGSAAYYYCVSDDGTDAPAAPSCSAVAPHHGDGGDVRVAPRAVTPLAVLDTPPDGTYVLIQASVGGADGSAFPITALEATLVVHGASLALGAVAETGDDSGPTEFFGLTLDAGVLTKECASGEGPVAASLLPGTIGATEKAELGWSAPVETLTLVVHAPDGDVELIFAPFIENG